MTWDCTESELITTLFERTGKLTEQVDELLQQRGEQSQLLEETMKNANELEVDKKELLRTIENFEERIRRKEKEINAAHRLATQRGARMQIMRDFIKSWEIEKYFLIDYPESADWFDEDGVPVREAREYGFPLHKQDKPPSKDDYHNPLKQGE